MPDSKTAADAEFSAIQTLYAALEPLDDDARSRVVNYIVARLEIGVQGEVAQVGGAEISGGQEEAEIKEQQKGAPKYGALAELFDDTQPTSNAEKALVAGYWLQVCQGWEDFDGQSANTELKHLGHGLGNITRAIDSLKNQKPALALQLKKGGKSRQARKVYKITGAGIRAVEEMING